MTLASGFRHPSHLWQILVRDLSLVALLTLAVFLFASGYIAGHLAPHGTFGPLDIQRPSASDMAKGFALLGIGLTTVVCLVIRLVRGRTHSGGYALPLITGAVSAWVFLGSNIEIALGLSALKFDAICALALSGAFLALWSFFGLETVRAERIVLVAAFASESYILPRVAVHLLHLTDFSQASLLTRTLVVSYMFAISGMVLAPIVCMWPHGRKWAVATLRKAAALPINLIVVGICISILASQIGPYSGAGSLRAGLVSDLGWVSLAGTLTLAVFAVLRVPVTATSSYPQPKKRRRAIWLLIGAVGAGYLVLSTMIARIWLDEVGPDGLSYLAIAREWGHGVFTIRGYWSPMLSWLAAPLIHVGVDPVVSLRAALILGGLMWIGSFFALARALRLSSWGQAGLTIAGGILAARYSVIPTTPDVLGTSFVLLYVAVLFASRDLRHPMRLGVLAGGLGALGYLAKYYNLPFYVLHIVVITGVVMAYRGKARFYLLASALLTTLLVCLPWLLALTTRYGHFTITTSGAINHALAAPGSNLHQPCWKGQLCRSPAGVLFPWEDPQPQYYAGYGWSAFSSWANLRFLLAFVVNKTIQLAQNALPQLGPITPAAILGIAYFSLSRWEDDLARIRGLVLSMTPLIYISGYLFNLTQSGRHFFPVYSLGLVAIYFLADKWLQRLHSVPGLGSWASVMVAITVLVFPILSQGSLLGIRDLFSGGPASCLRQADPIDQSILRAPMAGADESINYLAYQTQVQTYGVVESPRDFAGVNDQIRQFGIQSFLVGQDSLLMNELTSEFGYQLLGGLKICGSEYTVLAPP